MEHYQYHATMEDGSFIYAPVTHDKDDIIGIAKRGQMLIKNTSFPRIDVECDGEVFMTIEKEEGNGN